MTDTPTAVVTGAASGMGFATARRLGRDHKVVLADISEEHLDAAVAELATDGIDAVGVTCDVTDRDSVQRLFAIAAEHGRVRAVVHAAGVSPQMAPADVVIRVDAVGTVHVAEAALAAAHDGFALVNVASFAAHTSPAALNPRRTFRLARTDPERMGRKLTALVERLPARMRSDMAYTLSKAFVVWYSADIAADFGARGARAVSVSPGLIDTPMGQLESDNGGALIELSALKRMGRPEELAAVLAFCASEAPGYLTGTDVLVDGGAKAGLRLRDLIAMARQPGTTDRS